MKLRRRMTANVIWALTLVSMPALAAMGKRGRIEPSSTQKPSVIDAILEARGLTQLNRILQAAETTRRRERACVIQLRDGVSPTACYKGAVEIEKPKTWIRDLDEACDRLSRVATDLPRIFPETSTRCRDSIAARARDIQYAESATRRDASR